MPGIVDRLAAAEAAAMLADDRTVLTDHKTIGAGLDLDWPADGARGDRVLVVVEAHQAGLRDRRLDRIEAIKRAADRHQLRALRFEGPRPSGQSIPGACALWHRRHSGQAARHSAPHSSPL